MTKPAGCKTETQHNPHFLPHGLHIHEANPVLDVLLNADLAYYSFAPGSAQMLDKGDHHFDTRFLGGDRV